MRRAAKILAPLALLATLVAPLLYLYRALGEGPMKAVLLGAAVVWFVFGPHWMKGGSE